MGKQKTGAQVVSVFGQFSDRVLLELPRSDAEELLGGPITQAFAPTRVIDSVEADLQKLSERGAPVADSGLAQAAVALAYEIDSPFNSATSKSMCAKQLMGALDRLRELAPPEREKDRVDELAERRAERRGAAAKG